MGRYYIARQLGGKSVVSTGGKLLGKLVDLVVNASDGTLLHLLVEPSPDVEIPDEALTPEGYAKVPFNSVIAIDDFIVVDHRKIGWG